MNNSKLSQLVYFLLFSLIIITPCNGQESSSLAESSFIKAIASGTRQAKVTKMKNASNGLAGNVHCGLQAKNGNLWFGTTGHGVFYYDGHSFTKFTVIDGLNNDDVWCMAEDSKGNIWIGTSNGVALYNGKSFINFTKDQIFGNQAIWSLLKDKKGRIWISTDHNGTWFYDGMAFVLLTATNGIVNDSQLTLSSLNGMTEDKSGKLWFASWPPTGEGLSCYDGHSIARFTAAQGITDRLFHCVMQDKSGTVWAGSRDHGVFSYDGKSFTQRSDINGPGNDCIYSMVQDSHGNIWFTTEKSGVYRYDGKSFKNYTTSDGLINNSVFSVIEDKAGNLWFGTRNVGLCRYDGKSFINFSE